MLLPTSTSPNAAVGVEHGAGMAAALGSPISPLPTGFVVAQSPQQQLLQQQLLLQQQPFASPLQPLQPQPTLLQPMQQPPSPLAQPIQPVQLHAVTYPMAFAFAPAPLAAPQLTVTGASNPLAQSAATSPPGLRKPSVPEGWAARIQAACASAPAITAAVTTLPHAGATGVAAGQTAPPPPNTGADADGLAAYVGSHVEVAPHTQHFSGSWYCATLRKLAGGALPPPARHAPRTPQPARRSTLLRGEGHSPKLPQRVSRPSLHAAPTLLAPRATLDTRPFAAARVRLAPSPARPRARPILRHQPRRHRRGRGVGSRVARPGGEGGVGAPRVGPPRAAATARRLLPRAPRADTWLGATAQRHRPRTGGRAGRLVAGDARARRAAHCRHPLIWRPRLRWTTADGGSRRRGASRHARRALHRPLRRARVATRDSAPAANVEVAGAAALVH